VLCIALGGCNILDGGLDSEAARASLATAQLEGRFVFAYFTGNGEDGMKLATGDGREFRSIGGGGSVMRSALGGGLVRDPSIVRGPDGKWHAVWTTGWWAGAFGFAHSDDLVTWYMRRGIRAMDGVRGTVNTWAPEIHWDPERSEYLVIWSSTVRGMFEETAESSERGPDGLGLNHRIWGATTRDFVTWSEPRVFFDPGFNVIDAVIVRDEPRARWVMIFKDETLRPEVKKNLRVAFADTMQGTYVATDWPIAEAGTWVEGPMVLERDGEWTIYFDRYREGAFGAVRTRDWETFERVEPGPVMPWGARHGCVVKMGA
jgi:hypothetical protein